MLFWFIAIAVTAIACAALFYAARPHAVNIVPAETVEANGHFRLVLAGIDADLAAGKLGPEEAQAAKGELAREILRAKADVGTGSATGPRFGQGALYGGLAGIVAVALGFYAVLGSPQMPSQPLAERPELAAQSMDLQTAIARIESQLAANPQDLRGWTVIAPAYQELGRHADAVAAYRHVLELGGANADSLTALAEALLLQADGAGSPEAMDLLRQASAADPKHARSRLYIAAELTRTGNYPEAVEAWREALALAQGDEPWVAAARQGLLVAENNGETPSNDQENEMIAQMVTGLADRLSTDGGSVEEWMQLVRAYIVLGNLLAAQTAYDAAVKAYPLAFDRGELDTIALNAGLKLNGAQP